MTERCVECGHFMCPDPPAPGEVGERLAARLHQHPGKITVDRELIGEIRDVLDALASTTAEVERLRKGRDEYERQIASRDRTIRATTAALASAHKRAEEAEAVIASIETVDPTLVDDARALLNKGKQT